MSLPDVTASSERTPADGTERTTNGPGAGAPDGTALAATGRGTGAPERSAFTAGGLGPAAPDGSAFTANGVGAIATNLLAFTAGGLGTAEPDGAAVGLTSGPPAGTAHAHRQLSESRKAVAMVLALTAGLSLILALFVSIAVNSGPNGIRLAVAGPPAAVDQIQAGITQVGGADAFEISVVTDEAAARAALTDRTADGAIVIGPNGPTLLTASAGSPAITQLLTTAAAHLGNPAASSAAVVDVVPLPAGDARGVGLPSGTFPMIIAGLALGAAAALGLRNRWLVIGTVIGGAMTIAVSFAGILAWLGVSGGHFWAELSAISVTIAASALVVAGLVRLMGAAGAAVGALLLVIVGNPLSGIATSPRLLPAPWGEFGQWLPTGAGGTLLRSVAYFPGASVWPPLLILLGWAVLGGVMVLLFDHQAKAGRSSERSAVSRAANSLHNVH